MAPNRDAWSDDDDEGEESRQTPRPKHRRSSRSSHRKHFDQNSVDSGYGGSAATGSPRFSQRKIPDASKGGRSKHDAAGKANNGSGQDSDSDYDPKARYYLTVDDDDYKNMSFQGGGDGSGEAHQPLDPGASTGKTRESEREDSTSRRRRSSTQDRHRPSSHRQHRSDSISSSDIDEDGIDSRSYAAGRSTRHSSSSRRPKSRHDSSRRRRLSPIFSEPSEDWHTSPERPAPPSSRHQQERSLARRDSRTSQRRRKAAGGGDSSSDDIGFVTEEEEETRPEEALRAHTKEAQREGDNGRGSRSRRGAQGGGESSRPRRKRTLSEGGSSSYRGAADMEDAWYKTVKERLTKGVDMKQVRKVGLEAAAVAAVKVAVGTQIPWKQRIPKTIAVGMAAAVTDFIVSKTSFKPKGMVGTMYARQFVEIALANLIINPTSNKVQQKWNGQKPGAGQGMNKPAGGRARLGASATAPNGGRGRR